MPSAQPRAFPFKFFLAFLPCLILVQSTPAVGPFPFGAEAGRASCVQLRFASGQLLGLDGSRSLSAGLAALLQSHNVLLAQRVFVHAQRNGNFLFNRAAFHQAAHAVVYAPLQWLLTRPRPWSLAVGSLPFHGLHVTCTCLERDFLRPGLCVAAHAVWARLDGSKKLAPALHHGENWPLLID
jgi:hypothetical protein